MAAGEHVRLFFLRFDSHSHLIPLIVGGVITTSIGPDQVHGFAIVIDPLRAKLESVRSVLFPVTMEILCIMKPLPWPPRILSIPKAKTAGISAILAPAIPEVLTLIRDTIADHYVKIQPGVVDYTRKP